MSASGIVIPTLRSDAGSLLLGNTLGQRFHQLFHTQQEDNTRLVIKMQPDCTPSGNRMVYCFVCIMMYWCHLGFFTFMRSPLRSGRCSIWADELNLCICRVLSSDFWQLYIILTWATWFASLDKYLHGEQLHSSQQTTCLCSKERKQGREIFFLIDPAWFSIKLYFNWEWCKQQKCFT